MAREKKIVVDQIFRRSKENQRTHDIRPQSTIPTYKRIGNLENRGNISPPKSRKQEITIISWEDYEDLIKARQDDKDVVSFKTNYRSPSPNGRASSQGKSLLENQSKKRHVSKDFEDDFGGKRSTSAPIHPKENSPFPFLRRTSQVSPLRGKCQGSYIDPIFLEHGKRFKGELHSEDGCSIIITPRIPGDDMWRDASREPPSINLKLDQEGFTFKIPQYLIEMRGDSRRSNLHALSVFGEQISSHRRSAFVRSVMASTNTDEIQSTQVSNKYVTIAPKARLSTVIVPLNAKHWLLQIMCKKDLQLCELFDQMDLVPQFASDHIREVREKWEVQEANQMLVPLEAKTLIKDKTLLDKVKDLLVHFNEPLHNTSHDLNQMKEEKETSALKEIEDPQFSQSMNKRSRSPSRIFQFQGFERDCEGSLSPRFGLGANYCPLCRQVQRKIYGRDDQLPFSNPTKLVDGDGDTKRTYLSFNRWFIVLFPALQPANKEKVELLGEWLRYAINYNNCEDHNGRIVEVDSAFILHSIAFLEIVRQVRLQCEERGDLLLHVWRQILRLFSQVMIRVEPKLLALLKETSILNHAIYTNKKKNEKLSNEITKIVNDLETNEEQLKDKEFQWSQLRRCRLCTQSSLVHLKGSSKHGDSQIDDEKSSLEGDVDDLNNKDNNLGRDQGASDASHLGSHIISGIKGFLQSKDLDSYKRGKISKDFLHPDGFHANVATQTDQDSSGQSLFYNILKRPITAPARLIIAIMEEYQLSVGVVHRDLAEGEAKPTMKEPMVMGLTVEDIAMLDATDDMAEEYDIGNIDKHALKALASDGLRILGKLPEDEVEAKMAESLFGLLGRFRNLKTSASGDDEEDDGSGKKKSRWSKLKTGYDVNKKRGDRMVDLVQELLAMQKKPKDKMTKPKDLPNIPLGFSKMMKINPPPKMVKLFNERQVVKLVDSVYLGKMEADAIDDAQGNERQNACEFLYDYMLNSYGLKGLAESAIHGVFKRIKQMMIKGIGKSHKLRLFQQFCGYDPLQGYGEPDLYLYLRCLSKAQSKVGVLFPTENDDATYINTNPNQTDILLEEPTFMAQFRDNKEVALDFLEQYATANGYIEKVSNEVQKLVKSPTVRKLDFDLLMEAIIEIAPHKADYKKPQTKIKTAPKEKSAMTKGESASLETLFKAGDANQDGVLTFQEFCDILSTADSSISETKALRMFRETLQLMPDGGDIITPSAFATVALSNGIQATPAMIFNLLEKTWLQIQDDINEEKLVGADKKKDCEDMRDTLEGMLKERKPTNVFNTVNIFSDFVLKFCGEIEGTAKDSQETEIETIEDEEIYN